MLGPWSPLFFFSRVLGWGGPGGNNNNLILGMTIDDYPQASRAAGCTDTGHYQM